MKYLMAIDAGTGSVRVVIFDILGNQISVSQKEWHHLEEKGVYIIPDILANAGGVTVSYFEWVQNIQQFKWDEDHVNRELGKIMAASTRAVHASAKQRNVSLRTAAFIIAIERVAEAESLRGV